MSAEQCFAYELRVIYGSIIRNEKRKSKHRLSAFVAERADTYNDAAFAGK